MKKLFAILLVAVMIFTGCSSQPEEKYPPQKMDFGNGNYSWHYFDDKGQRIKYEVFKNDVLTEIHYIEFDENGNQVKKTTTDAEGNETLRDEITYENGKKTYMIRYRNGVVSMEDFYDENENCYLSKLYKDGVLYSWTESFYGDDNLATMAIGYRADGTAEWMNEYGEDENGNFTILSSYFNENEEVIKIVRKTSIQNGHREEVLFEKK